MIYLDESEHNILSLNIHISVCMPIVINTTQLPMNYNFKVHSCDIDSASCDCKSMELVLSFKYLVVTMDLKLKWSDHLHIVKNKMRRLATLFYKIRFLKKKKQ